MPHGYGTAESAVDRWLKRLRSSSRKSQRTCTHQNRLLTPDPLNPGQSLQIGQQSSRGVEASLALQLSNWRVEVNGTVLDAQYDDFSEAVNDTLVSRNGDEPVNVPDRSANLWVSCVHQ